MPREISSRSASESALDDLLHVLGAIPPCRATTAKIDDARLPSASPIIVKDWPVLHRCQSSARSPSEYPLAWYDVIEHLPTQLNQKVLQ
jgi:hypothetical protein